MKKLLFVALGISIISAVIVFANMDNIQYFYLDKDYVGLNKIETIGSKKDKAIEKKIDNTITPNNKLEIPNQLNLTINGNKFYPNIRYDKQEGIDLELHLLVPNRSDEKPAPLLLTLVAKKTKLLENNLDLLEKKMLARGYAVGKASLRYFEETSGYPDAYVDAKSAVRFIKANASQYGINPDKIAVMGSSKNGLFASAVGTMGNENIFEIGNNLSFDSKVAAVINFAGPTDFMKDKKMDCYSFECEEIDNQVNIISYLDKNDPPFYMMIGSEDRLIPHEQMERFKKKCDELGVAAYYDMIDGAPHGVAKFLNNDQVGRLVSFLVKYVE
ncbi:alpha/beta hydrolase [Candidatus Gracilibacteria bacterium]|nr:alpha/beta hydrolase [Candidatus Gracilibacteria bacterium]